VTKVPLAFIGIWMNVMECCLGLV